MTYGMLDLAELVARLEPGLRLEDLSVEDAARIDHALRNHTQTVWALEAALEDRVREILAPYVQRLPVRGTVYMVSGGQLRILR